MINFVELKHIYSVTNNSVIISQDNCPVLVTRYETMLEPASDKLPDINTDRVRHYVRFKNICSFKIVAIKFALNAFDSFNRFMGSVGGVIIEDISSNGESKGDFVQDNKLAAWFKNHGTGVVYVESIRAENGAIWRADMPTIIKELQIFQQDLVLDDLKQKSNSNL